MVHPLTVEELAMVMRKGGGWRFWRRGGDVHAAGKKTGSGVQKTEFTSENLHGE